MIRWLALLVLALAPVGVRAAPAASVPAAETQSLDAFAAANASCHEWSNGCVVCVRQGDTSDKGAFACSTPGIACTPSRLACRAPVSPPSPAAKP